jgi:hypothetical protein
MLENFSKMVWQKLITAPTHVTVTVFLYRGLERMWKKLFLPNFISQPRKVYDHMLV